MGILDITITSMFIITALSNSAYALIAPFLPFEFERKLLDSSLMGYVFAIYSVAVILFSPLIGMFIARFGRRNIINFGVILMGLSLISFGAASLITDTKLFVIVTFTIRFLQGVASSSI